MVSGALLGTLSWFPASQVPTAAQTRSRRATADSVRARFTRSASISAGTAVKPVCFEIDASAAAKDGGRVADGRRRRRGASIRRNVSGGNISGQSDQRIPVRRELAYKIAGRIHDLADDSLDVPVVVCLKERIVRGEGDGDGANQRGGGTTEPEHLVVGAVVWEARLILGFESKSLLGSAYVGESRDGCRTVPAKVVSSGSYFQLQGWQTQRTRGREIAPNLLDHEPSGVQIHVAAIRLGCAHGLIAVVANLGGRTPCIQKGIADRFEVFVGGQHDLAVRRDLAVGGIHHAFIAPASHTVCIGMTA